MNPHHSQKIGRSIESFLFRSPVLRLTAAKITVVVGLAASILLSIPLWAGTRMYPHTPLLPFLPTLPVAVEYILLGMLALLDAAILFRKSVRTYVFVAVAVLAIFVLFDQSRLQPWVFQYTFILLTIGIFLRKADTERAEAGLQLLRFILAATYFYSGLQKVNLAFIQEGFPWLVAPLAAWFPGLSSGLYLLGIFAPFIQMLFAIGLLTKRFRRVSLIVAVSMHLFILAMLGPWAHNWNTVVWPWTTALAVFDVILFAKNDSFSVRSLVRGRFRKYGILIIVLFGVLPALSFCNWWDSYLSSALYSSNTNQASVFLSAPDVVALPGEFVPYIIPVGAFTYYFNIQSWSLAEMNVPPYPETRIYKSVGRKLCSYLPKANTLSLVITENRMVGNHPETTYYCPQLMP